MRRFVICLSLAAIIVVVSKIGSAQNSGGDGNPSSSPERKDKQTHSKLPVSHPGACPSDVPEKTFVVDSSGSVSDTGRTLEGPLCVQVFWNPIQQFVNVQTSTGATNGPDLSKVVLGGPSAGGAAGTRKEETKPTSLPSAALQLVSDAKALAAKLSVRKQDYGTAFRSEDQAISDISFLRQTTSLLASDAVITAVKNGYFGLKDDLNTALTAPAAFIPTDQPDGQQAILLSEAQAQESRLAVLPLDYADGSQTTFECEGSEANVSWSAWYGKCKDAVYTPLKSVLDANLQAANDLANTSDNVKALKKEVAIVKYWDSLFSNLGLRTSIMKSDLPSLDISAGFYQHVVIRCGVLFNQTSNSSINIVTTDLGPTLQGATITSKPGNAFVIVSCGTPFAVSAGVGFSTIRQRQFAILQSSDGKGGTVNTFGLTNDSGINPVALAIAHVRLLEWDRHKYAFYASLGIAGSLQNQSSSSPVQFLPGISVSFWRTMYITAGPQIGTETSLTGGYKIGDTVPSGVSSVTGLLKTSRAVGLGLAITFTKP